LFWEFLGVGLLDLNRLTVVEFEAWAKQLDKVREEREAEKRQAEREAREAKRNGR
jgi:hypothetical protein